MNTPKQLAFSFVRRKATQLGLLLGLIGFTVIPVLAQHQDMNQYHDHHVGFVGGDLTKITVQLLLGSGWDKSKVYNTHYARLVIRRNSDHVETYDAAFTVTNGVLYRGAGAPIEITYWSSTQPTTDEYVIYGDGLLYGSGLNVLTNGSASTPQCTVSDHVVDFPGVGTPTIVTNEMEMTVTVNNAPDNCGCECVPGKVSPRIGSVDVEIDLGKGFLGNSYLSLRSEVPTALLASPAGLRVKKTTDTYELDNPLPRQVLSRAALADIVTLDAYSYQIRIYATNNTGPATNGLYYPNTNNIYKTVTIANPNGSTNYNTLVITDAQASAVTNVSTYSYDTNSSQWTMQSYNGLHLETLSRSWNSNNTERTELRTVLETNSVVRFQEQNIYHIFPWGEERIRQVLDPSGAALTNAWDYYTNSGANGYTFLKEMVSYTGYWERYEYDSVNRVTNRFSCFLNSPVGSASNACRVVNTVYASSAPHETIIETVLTNEVSRKYMVYSNDVIREIQCQLPGASWTDSSNLITITTNWGSAGLQFAGFVHSITHPDGTMDFYDYNDATGPRITALRSGQPNTAKTDIQEGTLYLTYIGTMGEPITNGVYAITNGTYGVPLSIESSSYVGGDSFKRSPTITHLDGLTTAIEWDCCGLASTTDRDGSSTQYLYDGQNRSIGTRLNNFMLTTTNLLDAAGNVLLTVRTDTNGSNMTLYLGTYDLAGRSVTESNGVTGITTHTNTFDGSGQLVKTNTFQDGGTRIETYFMDGSLKSISGTAVHPVNYAYGADTNGLYTLEARLTDGGGTNERVGPRIMTYWVCVKRSTHSLVQKRLGTELRPNGSRSARLGILS